MTLRLAQTLAWSLAGAALLGCKTQSAPPRPTRLPLVRIQPAPAVFFRGVQSGSPDKPGECDCNSPAHWDGDTLYVFNSAGHPWRSAGPDLLHLDRDYRKCEYNNQTNGGRWIECTWKDRNGALYGWYHLEPNDICVDQHPNSPHLTAPRIGAVKSGDNGAHWEDLGVILESMPVLRCDTTNYYFAGGNGDFSAMLDAREDFLYFFISTYAGDTSQQGVAVARMRWADRDQPVGRVWKWFERDWKERGLGGEATPVFPARIDWHRGDADAFWGPSIHWNIYLRQYVILLNRAKDSRWTQEGIYISFSPDLANPETWSTPQKILEAMGADRWYPQVVGSDTKRRETDKLAGREARLFVRGESRWVIQFVRPGGPSSARP